MTVGEAVALLLKEDQNAKLIVCADFSLNSEFVEAMAITPMKMHKTTKSFVNRYDEETVTIEVFREEGESLEPTVFIQ